LHSDRTATRWDGAELVGDRLDLIAHDDRADKSGSSSNGGGGGGGTHITYLVCKVRAQHSRIRVSPPELDLDGHLPAMRREVWEAVFALAVHHDLSQHARRPSVTLTHPHAELGVPPHAWQCMGSDR
jgi:hypothetical protein